MLQAIRDRVTGWIAWVIVALIAVVFALWGIDSYLKSEAKVYAARVNDVEISVPQYRFARQQQVQRMRNSLGASFDQSMVSSPEFKAAVLDRLIEEELLVQAAESAGMAISDAFLGARIRGIPDFQRDGEFSQELYQAFLAQRGMTPQHFEEEFRRALLIEQLVTSISGTSAVAPQMVEQALRLQDQERKLRYVRLPANRYLEDADIQPEAVAKFYEDNKSRFVRPERVRLQYVELSLDTIANELSATDAEIEQLYASEKDRLLRDEQRRARHILIEVDENAGEEAVAAARAKADDLAKRLREGQDFAALAKEHSDDPGSAAEGGDLGMFGKGMMVPEFEAVAFDLEKDQISDPVRTPFGFHVIQVTEIQAAEVPPLDELREQLAGEVVRRQAEEQFLDRSELLASLAFEHPDTLSVAAEQLDLTVQESPWLTPEGGEGPGRYPAVLEAAFSDDVLNGGNNSGPIEVEPNHVFVVRVLEHQPAEQVPLEKVRGAIEETLRQQAARQAAGEQGAALVERVRAGETLEAVAAAAGVEVEDAGFIARDESALPRDLVAAAFRVPRAADGEIATAGATLSSGDYVVLQIENVRDGDPSAVAAADRRAFRENLDQLYGSLETAALLEQLKARADVERVAERLD